MGVCNCSMVCCMLLYVHSSIAIILMGKRELIVLLNLSSWCLVIVERLFLAVPWVCMWFVIVVFPDHTHLLFLFLKVVMLHINFLNEMYDNTKANVLPLFTHSSPGCDLKIKKFIYLLKLVTLHIIRTGRLVMHIPWSSLPWMG